MEDDLVAFARNLDQCWLEQRFDELAAYLAPDVVFVAAGGARRDGREAAVESYRAFMALSTIRRFDASGYDVTASGDAAVVEYGWDMAWESEGKAFDARGREVLVLSRGAEGWTVFWRMQLSG
jgi:ketosteroid isomerase-like protein